MSRYHEEGADADESEVLARAARGRTLLVTVGSTHFEALIRTCDTPAFVDACRSHGITYLVLQYGPHGEYVPRAAAAYARDSLGSSGRGRGGGAAGLPRTFRVDRVRMVRAFGTLVAACALVVGHAGTGTLLDVLGAGRPLLLVPNSLLMHDHQRELADALADRGHVWLADPPDVAARLIAIDVHDRTPWAPGRPELLAARIDAMFGFAPPLSRAADAADAAAAYSCSMDDAADGPEEALGPRASPPARRRRNRSASGGDGRSSSSS